jgi:hypothetical protein
MVLSRLSLFPRSIAAAQCFSDRTLRNHARHRSPVFRAAVQILKRFAAGFVHRITDVLDESRRESAAVIRAFLYDDGSCSGATYNDSGPSVVIYDRRGIRDREISVNTREPVVS